MHDANLAWSNAITLTWVAAAGVAVTMVLCAIVSLKSPHLTRRQIRIQQAAYAGYAAGMIVFIALPGWLIVARVFSSGVMPVAIVGLLLWNTCVGYWSARRSRG